MIKSKIPIKKMRLRGRRLKKFCEENKDTKARSFRKFIAKLETGNDGKGYSINNIMMSYYSQKIIGLHK